MGKSTISMAILWHLWLLQIQVKKSQRNRCSLHDSMLLCNDEVELPASKSKVHLSQLSQLRADSARASILAQTWGCMYVPCLIKGKFLANLRCLDVRGLDTKMLSVHWQPECCLQRELKLMEISVFCHFIRSSESLTIHLVGWLAGNGRAQRWGHWHESRLGQEKTRWPFCNFLEHVETAKLLPSVYLV